MLSSLVKRYIAAVALLVSGIIVGAVGTYCWMVAHGPAFPPRPEEMRERIFSHLKREIRLTPEQEKLVRPEFEKAWIKGVELRKAIDPKFKAIMDETDMRMRVYLTPEQIELLDAFRKRLDERRGKFGEHPPPPPPMFGEHPPPPPPM
ncbi:hypothetical protein N1030_06615 [Desulfovibrio mangrovi]|uniref:hypothetical protein n=1 Tax=Desulfovibrio mangrovi TaxID=2976983 RepID=UPI0022468C90|nr:hypothetical protein [Desulfovibrio mangrovi]UZP68639.1 hypothetical protein N1030_06615 [Desulfovibrio mangrovi]